MKIIVLDPSPWSYQYLYSLETIYSTLVSELSASFSISLNLCNILSGRAYTDVFRKVDSASADLASSDVGSLIDGSSNGVSSDDFPFGIDKSRASN